MAGVTCPYLGIAEDAETALAYPSQSNCCFRDGSPVYLALEHQRKYCLATAYISCPIYVQKPQPLGTLNTNEKQQIIAKKPEEISPSRMFPAQSFSRKNVILAVVLLISLLVALFGVVWGKQLLNGQEEKAGLLNLFAGSPSSTPTVQTMTAEVLPTVTKTKQTFTPRVVLVTKETISQTPVKLLTNTATIKPSSTKKNEVSDNSTKTPTLVATSACGPPSSWVRYIVQVGDTLSSLSRVYGVSITQLQSANCMGGSTQIYTGSVIYVPFILSKTSTEVSATQTKTSSPPSATATKKPAATNTPIPTSPVTPLPIETINPTSTEDVLKTAIPTEPTP